ncbi:MAG TPA: undecaprenyl-diphosphate phosphatase [Candidatus Eisenbacteria bacterium]|nr:undecaprenyl-diphosphate phosphatase [Candidatus Eisenbacteria bacterium]
MLALLPPPGPMPTPLQALVLGAVQGLSELLPISSSAHLFLVPTLLGWPYAGVAFDVALHGGTLVALVAGFWGDWWALARDTFAPDAALRASARDLWAKLVVATIPGAIAGKLLGDLEDRLRSVPLQATLLFVFGLLLWLADRLSPPGRDERAPRWGQAITVGLSQALALVPGVSRSGITITAGRATGLSRVAAARFSFLLAAPITLGAVLLKLKDLPHDLPLPTLAIGVLGAAAFGILAIRFLMSFLRHAGLGVFFAYRALLALALVIWIVRR